jgi:serine transporter
MAVEQNHGSETSKWSGRDTRWAFTLFGTAIGAGILYLPLTASVGGIWALIFITLLIFPMTYLSHRALCRVVLTADTPGGDITEAVEDHFGKGAGFVITLIYFLAIYTVCLVYSIGITNEVNAFLVNILQISALPRWLLSLILIVGMTIVVLFGTNLMTRICSILVFPLIGLLFALSVMGMPYWKFDQLKVMPELGSSISGVLLVIPVLVFAMNFSPIISTFAVTYEKQIQNPKQLDRQTSRVIFVNSLLLLGFVMFFVFSVSLALTPEKLQDALTRNVSAMTVITELEGFRFIPLMASFIAITAIVSSYFGHFAGSREGLNGIIVKCLRRSDKNKQLNLKAIDRGTIAFHIITMWMVAVLDITIVGVISALTAPFIAIILYLMPIYAIHRLPKLARYRTPINAFVFIMGLITIIGYFASTFL